MRSLLILPFLALSLACSTTAPEGEEPVQEVSDAARDNIGGIVEMPSAYLAKTVDLHGEVVGSLPAETGSAFRLQDDTGVIVVVSDQAAPAEGAEVSVTGVVEQDIVVGELPVEVAVRESSRSE